MDADIIGFQEMETFSGGKFNKINRQRDWILQTVPGYRAAAVGDPKVFPSTQPIFYRPERFELVDQGWFYFSTTPDVIYSRSFDGGFDYYTSTARFRERASGEMLTVFNVHTDIRSGGNRRKATKMVAERAKRLVELWRARDRARRHQRPLVSAQRDPHRGQRPYRDAACGSQLSLRNRTWPVACH